MRQRSGCKACRERHIKCVKLRDSEKCKYCTERKRPCIRGNAFRFRPVTVVKFNAGEDVGSAEQSLEFRGSQTWVQIPGPLRFVPPNTEGDEDAIEFEPEESASEESGSAAFQQHQQPTNDNFDHVLASSYPDRTSFSALHRTHSHTSAPQDIPALLESPTSVAPILSPIHDVLTRTHIRTNSGTVAEHDQPTFSSDRSISGLGDSGAPTFSSTQSNSVHIPGPSSIHLSPPQDINISPFSTTAFSPNTALNLRWPVTNAWEARLLHHFIAYCTPWIDVCDTRCHFGREVPKRAAHFPVIMQGILGVAARHLWLLGKNFEDHSQPYIDSCLQALIVALEDPLAHWDENFLVAVILLRLHEEMGDADEQCHLFGSARILNSISSFAADGGLRESASWVSLRQHIYVSLTTQQPVNLSLDNYRHSSVFREYDEESWTNRIIFQFATILQHVFEETEGHSLTRDKWQELESETEEWERTKPWTYGPLLPDGNAGKEFHGSWPSLPTPSGMVAVGLQYYHLCKILLQIYSPHASLVGLAGIRQRKTTDAAIRKHIRVVIGYGVSNKHCDNAMFQGSHILSACGAYITDKVEQEACLKYLGGLQKEMGWRTDKVLADLKEQWTN
ncbi:hypothetical protein K491DRAFT_776521 [Lophiostoma macrostomum CBS 122681]|uniref:Zn(2)-C6 fungal-type domain-containing protein n=1 Tax=Lophiostoma macrostomum CBS 122681 TaxID=1314788 RepID=A0A6A6TEA7_9PLEO|nr:hypothetical protein K491DRAFT_776521 [Lophiostoma macrostomum CBS 122681]